MSLVTSSGTYLPAAVNDWASLPSSVCSAMFARKMSPVDTAGIPKRAASRLACVPFPAPGGPNRTSLMELLSSQEPFVVPLLELRLDLFHGLQSDPDDDEDRRAAEGEVLIGLHQDERDQRNQGDQSEIQRARGDDPDEHVVEVLSGGTARANARDEATVLLHVL